MLKCNFPLILYFHAKLSEHILLYFRSCGSSVSIVSDYRLDDRYSISGGGKELFL
jgi:hypothetical protein